MDKLQWAVGHFILTLIVIFLYPEGVYWLKTLLALFAYVVGSTVFWVLVADGDINLPYFGGKEVERDRQES